MWKKHAVKLYINSLFVVQSHKKRLACNWLCGSVCRATMFGYDSQCMEVKIKLDVCTNIKFPLLFKHNRVLLTCLVETVFAMCLNREMLQFGTYLCPWRTFILLISYREKGGGWDMGHGCACVWQRKQTARHGKFKSEFLIPENGKSERRQMLKKKKKRARDRMVGTSGETRPVPNPVTT